MIEITVKFFVFGPKHFCTHWMDVLDAVVTLVSLALDAFLIADHLLHITKNVEAFEAAAVLIIVFRLWRIVRIVNATLVGIHNAMHTKLHRMKQTEARLQCRIYQLERRLNKYNIPLPKNLESEQEEIGAPQQRRHRALHSHMKQLRNNSSKTLFKVGSDQTFDGLGSAYGTSTDLTDAA
ncbi:hypothetical protein EG68_12557 [Paragonimus skrjabini miyazakii]|uniref:Voltage-gated hydrogen channel 1 n=1 Tax=Paragonimus skrjabini miyazakii TaxID=59628 RepID=A0A8S9YID8_9TREM|nr:hypothetical protein EG68_12557 [Paragonimus skrjabini miyazakii]